MENTNSNTRDRFEMNFNPRVLNFDYLASENLTPRLPANLRIADRILETNERIISFGDFFKLEHNMDNFKPKLPIQILISRSDIKSS